MPLGIQFALIAALVLLLFYCKRQADRAQIELNAMRKLADEAKRFEAFNQELQAELLRHRDALLANSSFMANVGQELRSPLSGVLGMNELLLHTDLTNEQRELAIASMESAQTLLLVISDLQELARVEAGELTPNVVPINASDIIRQACCVCAEGARRKKLFVNLDCDPEIPESLFGDPRPLRHVITQLLRNAIQTTETGGIVVQAAKVGLQAEQVLLRFSVKDTGIGLTEDEQSTIFLPFSGEDVWTRSYSGTGLGLYLCKRTVDTMGGALSVQSKKGVGTEFQFTLAFSTNPGVVSLPVQDVPAESDNHLYKQLRHTDH